MLGVNIGKTKLVPPEQAVADYVTARPARAVRRLLRGQRQLAQHARAARSTGGGATAAVVAGGASGAGRRRAQPPRAAAGEDRARPRRCGHRRHRGSRARARADGIVAVNTTLARDGLRSAPDEVEGCGAGGLSGAPLRARARGAAPAARPGRRPLALISVGGIETADDAWDRLRRARRWCRSIRRSSTRAPACRARSTPGLRGVYARRVVGA